MIETLAINSILEWIDKPNDSVYLERVLFIDNKLRQVFLFNLSKLDSLNTCKSFDEISEAAETGLVHKTDYDPFFFLANPDSEYLAKHINERDWAWEIISDLVFLEPDIYLSEIRGQLIKDAAIKSRVQEKTVYKYLKRYWAGGKIKNALLPNFYKCGGSGKERKAGESKRGRPSNIEKLTGENTGINIDEHIKEKLVMGYRLYYNHKMKMPRTRAYQLTLEHLFNQGYRSEGKIQVPVIPSASNLPTLGQFVYWGRKKISLKKTLIAREGKRGHALRHRAILGKSTRMSLGPGSLYQIDATIVDIYLVCFFDRTRIIGRPVCYIVIDVFSRMIVGIYISLEGPSWTGMRMALANTIAEKTRFCADYDIEISENNWPCKFLPGSILGDRGELLSKNADFLAESLGITVLNTPSYRADFKGIVEQMFRKVNLEVIHWLPGAVKERYRERGEPDHRLDATLDLNQFTKILLYMVLDYNENHLIEDYSRDEFMIQENVKPIPLQLWQWGINNRSGTRREISPERAKIALMPKDEATVTFRGIRFKGMYFRSNKAEQDEWFQRARSFGSWKVPIAYDNRRADIIYLLLENNQTIEPCYLLEDEERYKNRRLEDVLELREMEKELSFKHLEEAPQKKADLNAKINFIVKAANEETKLALSQSQTSKRQRVRDIRLNRAENRELIREKEAWVLGDAQPEKKVINAFEAVDSSSHGPSSSSKQKKFLEIIKNQNEEM